MKFVLNKQQQEAVNFVSGPCLVIAGAGSGKTRVISEKISHLIKNCGYLASEICAVTFTNKAAKEMKERVSKTLQNDQLKGILITTFHSLGLYIIKREYKKIGLKKDFILFDDRDQRQLIITILKDLSKTDATPEDEDVNRIIKHISNAKINNISAKQDMADTIGNDKVDAIIYDQYEKMLTAYSALDFDDLILKPLILFRDRQDVLLNWQRKIKYILVDEYQDTNNIQYEFIKLLVQNRQKFTFVGDDDQSIYAWRGAQPENINNLVNDFPFLKVMKLEQNYRSMGRILKCANTVISNNSHLFSKALFSNYAYGDKIVVHECLNPNKESEYISAEIVSNRFLRQGKWKDFAVLYRTNYISRDLEKNLMENNIPYRINGDVSFFERTEVKDILSYYRVLANPKDDNALIRIINVPRREIGNITTEKLGNFSRNKQISLFESVDYLELKDLITPSSYSSLVEFKDYIESCREEIEQGNAISVVNRLFTDIEYKNHLMNTNKDEKVANIKYDNICTLKNWLINKLKGNSNENIEPLSFDDAVRSICLREMLDQTENENADSLDQVQLMTLHSSKGLEFSYVYIIGCEEDVLPHKNSLDSNMIEEERRLFYVGVTRAKNNLTLTFCKNRGENKGINYSRFIDEMPLDDIDMQTTARKKEINSNQNIQIIDRLMDLIKK